mgnify:CR=1 FL=1
MVLLSNDEFFLNRIEAHVMTNQFDLANAELEYFFSTRTEEYNPTTDKVTEETAQRTVERIMKIKTKIPVEKDTIPLIPLVPAKKIDSL